MIKEFIVSEPISPEQFLEKIRSRNDVALIYLKGGEAGGANPEVKPKILELLSRWFDVTEGEASETSFQEIATRWGSTGMQYQFKKMRMNEKFGPDFLKEGNDLLVNGQEKEFYSWLEKAKGIDSSDVGLLRQEAALNYFKKGGEPMLLKLKAGIDRNKILNDLGLENQDKIKLALGEKKAQINWLDEDEVPFQEFVKNIIVGNTVSYKAIPGTIRNIVAEELKQGALRGVVLAALENNKKNPAAWQAMPGDFNDVGDDEETMIATFFNGVHSVDLSPAEFGLIKEDDLEKFNNAL